jgi:hypothetical protein
MQQEGYESRIYIFSTQQPSSLLLHYPCHPADFEATVPWQKMVTAIGPIVIPGKEVAPIDVIYIHKREAAWITLSGTTPALSPTNGGIQTWTLSGSSTPTAGTWAAGTSMTLQITASTNTVTWTSVAVSWVGGTAPTLSTTGITVIELWKVGSTVYGALVGSI